MDPNKVIDLSIQNLVYIREIIFARLSLEENDVIPAKISHQNATKGETNRPDIFDDVQYKTLARIGIIY